MNQLAGESCFAPGASGLDLRAHPLSEVLEVGFGPFREFEVLITLAMSVLKQRLEILLNLIGISRG